MVGMPHVWGVDPYNSQKWSDVRTNVRGGYSVHSHLFQHLEPDTRYEVIVQSKNHFGWSEPTKPFIFTTRYKGTYNYTQKCRKRFQFLFYLFFIFLRLFTIKHGVTSKFSWSIVFSNFIITIIYVLVNILTDPDIYFYVIDMCY